MRSSQFSSPRGAGEIFLALQSNAGVSFASALSQLSRVYGKACEEMGLSAESIVFTRIYLSDIAIQHPVLSKSPLFAQLKKGAVSVVQQRPLPSSKIAVLICHMKPGKGGRLRKTLSLGKKGGTAARLEGGNYRLIFTGGNWAASGAEDVKMLAADLFASLDFRLHKEGMSVLKSNLRTWIFLSAMEKEYGLMVEGRKEYFAGCGWKEGLRYPASTGIGGVGPALNSRIVMDSLSMGGLQPEQIRILEAPRLMSPAMRYGVTFERGLQVLFGDRSHFHISGTASIGLDGEILHPNDAAGQTDRALRNIRSLLKSRGADFRHMMYWIIYVRNAADFPVVSKRLRENLPAEAPCLFLEAEVCRPGWLVEIEGWAIKPEKNGYPVFF